MKKHIKWLIAEIDQWVKDGIIEPQRGPARDRMILGGIMPLAWPWRSRVISRVLPGWEYPNLKLTSHHFEVGLIKSLVTRTHLKNSGSRPITRREPTQKRSTR